MEPCRRCSGFAETIKLPNPREYRDLARQLIEKVEQGTFNMTRADCRLEEIFGPVWPGDVLVHEFNCTACGRRFSLDADTYHGYAIWRLL